MHESEIAVLISTFLVFTFLLVCFVVLLIKDNIRRKRQYLSSISARESAFKKELKKAQLEMQEHTFQAVSRDIHDNVGQILSLVKLNLNIMAAGPQPPAAIFDTRKQLNEAIDELRKLGNGYYAAKLLDTGLHNAVRNQLAQLEKTGRFTVSFKCELERTDIDATTTVTLYRIVQESLSNITKHADASHISVAMLSENKKLHITICDNGKGFDTRDRRYVAGMGMGSMRYRAEMIGASLHVESLPGQGTTVHVICAYGCV